MHYTLLENGLDFVHYSLINLNKISSEKTNDNEKKRLIKYSLLHLSSGIELILKNRVMEEHWTYIFADMNQATKESFESGDFSSLGFLRLYERLKNLCDIQLDKKDTEKFDKLRKYRNKLEHFETKINTKHFIHLINDATKAIIDFLLSHCSVDLEEEQALLNAIQDELRDSDDFYQEALKIAQTTAYSDKDSDYSFLTCPECEEDLLSYGDGDNVHCYFCKYNDSPENAADLYLENILGLSSYSIVKDGGEYPLYNCPECDSESLINGGDFAICFNCNQVTSFDGFQFCIECNALYSYSEGDELDICSDCIDYKISRD